MNVWDETLKAIGHIQPKINTLDLNTADILLNLVGVENIQSLLADYIRDRFIHKNNKRIIRKACSRNDVYIRSVLDYFKKREEAHRKSEADRKWQEDLKRKEASSVKGGFEVKHNSDKTEKIPSIEERQFNETILKIRKKLSQPVTSHSEFGGVLSDIYTAITKKNLIIYKNGWAEIKSLFASGMTVSKFIKPYITINKDTHTIFMKDPWRYI